MFLLTLPRGAPTKTFRPNVRRYRGKPETLGTCSERIHRHNETVQKIAGEAIDKGYSVTRKKSFKVGEQTLKPGLVLKDEQGAFVVDVTVRHESKPKGSLEDASLEECEKYHHLAGTRDTNKVPLLY